MSDYIRTGLIGVGQNSDFSSHNAIVRIRELLDLPNSKKWCRGGSRPMRLRSRKNPKEKIMALWCQSWRCKICREALLRRAGEHFGVMILRSKGMIFDQLSEPEKWPAQQKQFRRQGVSWVRIGCVDHPGIIIGSAPPSVAKCHVHNDWETAVTLLGKSLRDLGTAWDEGESRIRPITSSHDWSLPETESKYERIGVVRCTKPESLVDALNAIGIPSHFRPADGKGLRWDVTYDIPEHDEKAMELLDTIACSLCH